MKPGYLKKLFAVMLLCTGLAVPVFSADLELLGKDDLDCFDVEKSTFLSIDAEFNDKPHVRGALSMARSRDPDSAGSQFFIVVKKSSFLDNNYTVFGEVVSGMDVADKIVSQEKDARDNPIERIEMTILVIEPEQDEAEGEAELS